MTEKPEGPNTDGNPILATLSYVLLSSISSVRVSLSSSCQETATISRISTPDIGHVLITENDLATVPMNNANHKDQLAFANPSVTVKFE